MLHDWSATSLLHDFKIKPSVSTDLELTSLKWCNSIEGINILYWFDTWHIVPSSDSLITPAVWLQIYQMQQWTSFDEFIKWLRLCYWTKVFAPLELSRNKRTLHENSINRQ